MNKRIKIVSDGTPLNTRIYDAAGYEIKGAITKIEWSIDPDKAAEAKITFAVAEVEIVGEISGG